jgi:hypothetical protein
MRLRGLKVLFLFVGLVLQALQSAQGWDEGGHEIVATIALGRLNAKARAAVEALATQVPSAGRPYDAVTMACWMDDLRDRGSGLPQAGMFLSWHFVDIGLEPGDPVPSFTPGTDDPTHGDAVQALQRALTVLRGGTDPYVTSPAIACAMMMHLVADIHQPLHAATKYFYSHGREQDDRGGNREYVDNAPLDEPRFNLHAFWDSAWRATLGPDGRVQLDERFRPGWAQNPAEVTALAARMAQEDAPPTSASLATNFESWAWESNAVARNFVYRDLTPTESLKYCRLSSSYVAEANRLARQRLVLAAWRLAVVLNETIGK